jgi:hypothetical protein
MLKQFKIITLAPTCFGSHRNHHQEAVLCLAKTTKYGFSLLVDIDVFNVMTAYQPVVQACGSASVETTKSVFKLPCLKNYVVIPRGHAVRSWLGHCGTN